ncbi:24475_t:CDS:2, partial [Entrophospora sp. SA101]
LPPSITFTPPTNSTTNMASSSSSSPPPGGNSRKENVRVVYNVPAFACSASLGKVKKAASRVRMKMCDAPKNLVKLINSNYITPSPAIISDNIKVNNIVSKGNSSNNIGKDNNKDRN